MKSRKRHFFIAVIFIVISLMAIKGWYAFIKEYTPYKSDPSTIMHNKPGAHFIPLSEMNAPADIKASMREEIQTFLRTGSTTGGVATNEFSAADAIAKNLKNEGLEKIKSSLAIIPTDLCALAGDGFYLYGADVQAKMVSEPNEGWAGFLQVCKQNNSTAMLKLSERQLELAYGDGSVGPIEMINTKVAGALATFQTVKTPDGTEIYNLQWTIGSRDFTLVSKNVSPDFHRQLAERISIAYQTMPNEGWKKPYTISENTQFILNELYGTQ